MNSEQTARRAGITYRQLDHWTRKGWFNPIGGVGTGTQRDYPSAEVEKVCAVAKLVHAGLLPEKAAMIVVFRDMAVAEKIRSALLSIGVW